MPGVLLERTLSHASVILAKPGSPTGFVATAFEQPHLHDLEIKLDKYPEVMSVASRRFSARTQSRQRVQTIIGSKRSPKPTR
ncbi:MAG: hypothetical protein ABJC63_11170 [Gemmatimonadales bacterium]